MAKLKNYFYRFVTVCKCLIVINCFFIFYVCSSYSKNFVVELDEYKKEGDTFLRALTRYMGKTFIDKYEFDQTLK